MEYKVVEIMKNEVLQQETSQAFLAQAKIKELSKDKWEMISSLFKPMTGSIILFFERSKSNEED
ncbi:unnamed protein product [Fructobacillus fructosus]|uniref:DUF4177 domain-containing protein n=1 Tax=Fructobacillus fructosus TaxID=1631 RepID=A0ABM9MZH3_9LACO|nr:unnamed protein product [Fructobacillus fructosus]